MLNGIVDSQHVRAEKVVKSSQSTGAVSSFFSHQSEIEQLNETLRQRDEEQRQRYEMQMAQYEVMRQRDNYYAQAFIQQQLILQVS
jgi:3-hydroxy-3-methylglutaryl CoA synthase